MFFLRIILLFGLSGLLISKEIISEFEYGQMLYNNPRGVSCMPCHGLKGEGSEIVKYRDKGKTISLFAPDIRQKSFKEFQRATSKGPKVMPKYFLTQEELRAIFQYIKSANLPKEEEVDSETEQESDLEDEPTSKSRKNIINFDVNLSNDDRVEGEDSQLNQTVDSSSYEVVE